MPAVSSPSAPAHSLVSTGPTPVRAVVTGFEPFDGGTLNASWEAVRALSETVELGEGLELQVERHELPVTFTGATRRAREIAASDPDIQIHVGLDARAQAVALESRAWNEQSATIPDNLGYQPQGEPVCVGAEPVLSSTWAVDTLVGRLRGQGHDVVRSDDAGRYVCNATLFAALAACRQQATVAGRAHDERAVGFVHVPQVTTLATPLVTAALTDLLRELAAVVARRRSRAAGLPRTAAPREERGLRVVVSGGIGSGKSTVSSRLAELCGTPVIDADDIARQVVEPGEPALTEITEAFGESVLHADGSLNRSALAALVFSSPARRERLEGMTLPRIGATAAERMEAAVRSRAAEGYRHSVYDMPLLAESGAADLFDLVVIVTAPQEVRLQRLRQRGLSREDALARMANQASDEQRESLADVIIDNSSGLEDLEPQISLLYQERLA